MEEICTNLKAVNGTDKKEEMLSLYYKSSQNGLVPVKGRNWATISDKERVKERWVKHIENMLVAGKDIEENEICDTLDVKEDLFCEYELATVLKGLKIIRRQMLIVW